MYLILGAHSPLSSLVSPLIKSIPAYAAPDFWLHHTWGLLMLLIDIVLLIDEEKNL